MRVHNQLHRRGTPARRLTPALGVIPADDDHQASAQADARGRPAAEPPNPPEDPAPPTLDFAVPTDRPVALAIADSSPMQAESLAALLRKVGFAVTGVTDDAAALAELADRDGVDVVIVTEELGGRDGIDVLGRLVTDGGPSWLVLGTSTSADRVARALNAGARGYVPRTCSVLELAYTVYQLAEGKAVLHPDVTAGLLERIAGQISIAGVEPLSAKEAEVLTLVGDGLANRDIAAAVGVTEETVKSHLKRINRKLRSRSRHEAHRIARSRGLI